MIEVLKQALEALEKIDGAMPFPVGRSAITSLRQAIAELESQEPVAWMHTKIDGVAVPHRPSDLDKHPERWEALYKTPPPCPTCEALARTVMLDQTSHDTHPPQRKPLTDEDVWKALDDTDCTRPMLIARAIEAAHGIKELKP